MYINIFKNVYKCIFSSISIEVYTRVTCRRTREISTDFSNAPHTRSNLKKFIETRNRPIGRSRYRTKDTRRRRIEIISQLSEGKYETSRMDRIRFNVTKKKDGRIYKIMNKRKFLRRS